MLDGHVWLNVIGRSLATSYGKNPRATAQVCAVYDGLQRAKNQRNDILFAIISLLAFLLIFIPSFCIGITLYSYVYYCIILRLLTFCVAVDDRQYIRLTFNTLQFAKSYMIFVENVLKLYTPEIHTVAMEALGKAFYAQLKHFKRSFQTPAFVSQV